MLRSKQHLRNSINLTAAGKKSSVHLQREILGLVICPQAGVGAQGELGSTALAGPSHRDQSTLTPVHGLPSVQKACYREVIHQDLSTGSFLQEKQFLPAFLSVTLFLAAQGLKSGHSRGIPQWSKGKHTSEQLVC